MGEANIPENALSRKGCPKPLFERAAIHDIFVTPLSYLWANRNTLLSIDTCCNPCRTTPRREITTKVIRWESIFSGGAGGGDFERICDNNISGKDGLLQRKKTHYGCKTIIFFSFGRQVSNVSWSGGMFLGVYRKLLCPDPPCYTFDQCLKEALTHFKFKGSAKEGLSHFFLRRGRGGLGTIAL